MLHRLLTWWRTTRAGHGLRLVAAAGTLTVASAYGQVNAWIDPASGNWDDASAWSLGVLPASSQSVLITNSVWKAVAINPLTPIHFPNSMTVSTLTLRGAWDTRNVLLLNWFGTATPLVVLNGLTLQDNAQVVNFHSGLVVQGGTVVVTNAQVIQDGGLVRTANAPMYLRNAEYDLTNGVFEAGQVSLGLPVPARVNQYGGLAVIADLQFGRGSAGAGGTYALYGGDLHLPNGLKLIGDNNSSSMYLQTGGTNRTSQVFLEPGYFGMAPSFTLSGGLLASGNVFVVADDFGSQTLYHNGGTHVVTNSVNISGAAGNAYSVHPATYRLNAGTLCAGAMVLASHFGDARFIQTNGLTQAGQIQADGYWAWKSEMTLSGGTLNCAGLTLTNGANLHQYDGTLVVTNNFSFGGHRDPGPIIFSRYELLGGTLSASNIVVGGDWIMGDSAGGNRISNPGTCSLSHTLQTGNVVEQLGRFILAADAKIDLAGSASRLSFAESRGESWSGTATLIVTNWNGNLAGGGAEQLKFGTSQSGLTSGQLSEIRFSFGTNTYPAKLLGTGELVPDILAPTLSFSRQGHSLVLTWSSGFLQAATNATGPYLDVPGAASPYSADMSVAPQQFFLLRP